MYGPVDYNALSDLSNGTSHIFGDNTFSGGLENGPRGITRDRVCRLGAQGADGNRRLPNLPRGFLLEPSERAKRAGALRHEII